MKLRAFSTRAVCAIAASLAAYACGGGQQQIATTTTTQTVTVTTPPPLATPVPVVRAHSVIGAGRGDPFVALYGPPTGGPAPSAPTRPVAVSSFPNIPTLPGFEGAPGAAGPKTIWDTVRVTGILHNGAHVAIVEANGQSYIVHAGDSVGGTFRVVAIADSYVTLATSKEQRNVTLGG